MLSIYIDEPFFEESDFDDPIAIATQETVKVGEYQYGMHDG